MRLFKKQPPLVRQFTEREREQLKKDRIRRFNEIPGGSLAELHADLRQIDRLGQPTR